MCLCVRLQTMCAMHSPVCVCVCTFYTVSQCVRGKRLSFIMYGACWLSGRFWPQKCTRLLVTSHFLWLCIYQIYRAAWWSFCPCFWTKHTHNLQYTKSALLILETFNGHSKHYTSYQITWWNNFLVLVISFRNLADVGKRSYARSYTQGDLAQTHDHHDAITICLSAILFIKICTDILYICI